MVLRRDNFSWPFAYFLIVALVPGHLADWGVEWLFASATTLLGICVYPAFSNRYAVVARVGLLLVGLITLASLVSYISVLIQGRFYSGLRDVVEILKPAMTWFSASLAFSFGAMKLDEVRRGAAYVLYVTLFFAGLLYFYPPVLGSAADALYGSTKTNISEFIVRISIPFENPNFLGLFSVLCLGLGLWFGSSPSARLVVLALVAIGLSGSRTAWLTGMLMLLVFGLQYFFESISLRRSISLRGMLLIFCGVLLGVYYLPALAESYQRFADLIELVISMDFKSDESYYDRTILRQNAMNLILERPLLGWGAIKYSSVDIVDSQYYSLFLRFGILGVACLAMGAVGLFIKNVVSLPRRRDRRFLVFVWLVLAAWLWNGSFLENIRLATLVAIIFAAYSSHESSTA